jgi:type IV pilus biogenesis protein CpaD/CtpE
MRLVYALAVAALLAACEQREPNPFPDDARARFEMSCPPASEVCVCAWDKIIRAMPYEDYEAALSRFRATGSMDTRITKARTECLEQHDE